jgi:hypothetical protein
MRKSLGASESSVSGTDWPSGQENRTVSFEHNERRVLIGQPAKGREGNESVSTNYD